MRMAALFPEVFERTPDFEALWKLYPKKRIGNKEKAYKAFKRALKRASYDEILFGVEQYRESQEVRRGYAKGLEAWLNDDRWACDYSPVIDTAVLKSRYRDLKKLYDKPYHGFMGEAAIEEMRDIEAVLGKGLT